MTAAAATPELGLADEHLAESAIKSARPGPASGKRLCAVRCGLQEAAVLLTVLTATCCTDGHNTRANVPKVAAKASQERADPNNMTT